MHSPRRRGRIGALDAFDGLRPTDCSAPSHGGLERGEKGRMVTLSDGKYSHVPVDTLLHGRKSVDVSALYDRGAYRARLMRVEDMPMFLY